MMIEVAAKRFSKN